MVTERKLGKNEIKGRKTQDGFKRGGGIPGPVCPAPLRPFCQCCGVPDNEGLRNRSGWAVHECAN